MYILMIVGNIYWAWLWVLLTIVQITLSLPEGAFEIYWNLLEIGLDSEYINVVRLHINKI